MSSHKAIAIDNLWLILLGNAGICVDNVLRRAQFPSDLLTQAQAKLSLEEYVGFWSAIEAEANDRTLPIRLGQAVSPKTFHPALFAALCSSNLSVALTRISKHKRSMAPITLTIEEGLSGLSVYEEWDSTKIALPPTLAVFELVFLTQVARIGTREHICPIKVESLVPLEPLAAYGSFFGVTPQPSERPGVTFDYAAAKMPFLTASESLWEVFGPELRRRITRLDASLPIDVRVRSVLLESLPGGEPSITVIAQSLGLSPRTLQRKLRLSGTSFRKVVNQTRERLARHYLTSTSLTVLEIAYLLGFDEPSSFFRAFREWTGTTPAAVRTGNHQTRATGSVPPAPVTSGTQCSQSPSQSSSQDSSCIQTWTTLSGSTLAFR